MTVIEPTLASQRPLQPPAVMIAQSGRRPLDGHAEPLGDLGGDVDVEALEGAVGLLGGLRGVVRVRGDHELAGLEDLVEQAAGDRARRSRPPRTRLRTPCAVGLGGRGQRRLARPMARSRRRRHWSRRPRRSRRRRAGKVVHAGTSRLLLGHAARRRSGPRALRVRGHAIACAALCLANRDFRVLVEDSEPFHSGPLARRTAQADPITCPNAAARRVSAASRITPESASIAVSPLASISRDRPSIRHTTCTTTGPSPSI